MLNLNSAFFGEKAPSRAVAIDPYLEMQALQREFQSRSSQSKDFIRGLVYHTDIDHPLSFHRQALTNTANNLHLADKVSFPKLEPGDVRLVQ